MKSGIAPVAIAVGAWLTGVSLSTNYRGILFVQGNFVKSNGKNLSSVKNLICIFRVTTALLHNKPMDSIWESFIIDWSDAKTGTAAVSHGQLARV